MPTTFTLDQIASMFNIAGVAAALAFSFFIARRHSTSYFGYWTASYGAAFTAILFDHLRLLSGAFWVGSLELFLHTLSSVLLIETRQRMQDRGRRGSLMRYSLYALMLALGPAIYAVTGDFIQGSFPTLLLFVGVHLLASVTVWRMPVPWTTSRAILALNLFLLGATVLAYPFFVWAKAAWLGYAMLGILHASVGVGMVVFVLDEKNRELRRLDELKNQFLSNVSHELRTPLTAIKGAAALLRMGAEVQKDELLRIIDGHTLRLGTLISDLLDFARLQDGNLPLEHETLDLSKLLETTLAELKPLIAPKRQEVSLALPPGSVWVRGDGAKLRQIADNLIVNASKFTPADGALSLAVEPAGAGWWRVVFEDSGPGVAASERESIFERFYQIEGGAARLQGGTGLGLAIARGLAEAHGGTLRAVEPSRGSGARFELQLPAVPAPERAGLEVSRQGAGV